MDLTALTWRKASRSGENGGACVELASASDVIVVRDSKNPTGPRLTMSRPHFQHLARTLKNL
ncbi:DUF397 domain-containing protein [Actinomadura decatromicini]|uniref:DUF397 domain-containing protein n=1 Tax=Actinomadura decatromicini TaxID=2604572 RepID=A0A5D3FHF9_9ACTN|nr:DUF397 domain-containing protein [Actinomadura decatromicini]TYK46725.1 DUF397 domain-containing protein [Actinomadura decatromicini]